MQFGTVSFTSSEKNFEESMESVVGKMMHFLNENKFEYVSHTHCHSVLEFEMYNKYLVSIVLVYKNKEA